MFRGHHSLNQLLQYRVNLINPVSNSNLLTTMYSINRVLPDRRHLRYMLRCRHQHNRHHHHKVHPHMPDTLATLQVHHSKGLPNQVLLQSIFMLIRQARANGGRTSITTPPCEGP